MMLPMVLAIALTTALTIGGGMSPVRAERLAIRTFTATDGLPQRRARIDERNASGRWHERDRDGHSIALAAAHVKHLCATAPEA